jgi:hypothetical protein
MTDESPEQHLRHLILGLLHVGRLKPGDPLPSIRQVAKETGADHRAVAAAYRVLEAEGLVEIRPGSGVYLAGEGGGAAIENETARWLSGVMMEGWSRRVARADVGALVERCAAARVRCACIESNEDHMVAVVAELEADFSLEVRPVMVSPSADGAAVPREALASADLVVTTIFHAAAGRAAAAAAGKPCIVLTINPQFAAGVNRRLAGRDVTAIAADPRFVARARAYLDVTPHRGQVRLVVVDELGREAPPDLRSEDVLVTRAARRRLGLEDQHLIPSPPTFISPESARELYEAVVQLALHP